MTKPEVLFYESVPPHLLRNKALRGYLGQYNGKDWPEVVKLTLLYGVLNLQKRYPGEILPIERLRAVLMASQSAITVEHLLPNLQDQLQNLQVQLAEVTDDIESSKVCTQSQQCPLGV